MPPLSVWHSRLGHPFESIIQRLLQQSQLSILSSIKLHKLCDSCQLTKSQNFPFSASNSVHNSIGVYPFRCVDLSCYFN